VLSPPSASEGRPLRLLRLYATLFSMSLRGQLAFRTDLVFEIGRALIALVASLAALWAVFTRTDQLGGFSPRDAIALLGTFQIVSGLRQGLVEPNLRFNGSQVANGSFDALLTQPAPAIFLASLGGAAPLALIQTVLGLVVVIAATLTSPSQPNPNPTAIAGWLVLVAAATVLMWATRCIIAATVFWSLGLSLDVAYDAAWQLGAYPTTMLSRPLRAITTGVLVTFIATLPTAVLTGRIGPAWILAGVVAAVVAVIVAVRLWTIGIRNYTSATS